MSGVGFPTLPVEPALLRAWMEQRGELSNRALLEQMALRALRDGTGTWECYEAIRSEYLDATALEQAAYLAVRDSGHTENVAGYVGPASNIPSGRITDDR